MHLFCIGRRWQANSGKQHSPGGRAHGEPAAGVSWTGSTPPGLLVGILDAAKGIRAKRKTRRMRPGPFDRGKDRPGATRKAPVAWGGSRGWGLRHHAEVGISGGTPLPNCGKWRDAAVTPPAPQSRIPQIRSQSQSPSGTATIEARLFLLTLARWRRRMLSGQAASRDHRAAAVRRG